MDIIPATAPTSFTSDTTFSNYVLIVDAQSKITKLYGIDKITTEEVMDRLDMFQYPLIGVNNWALQCPQGPNFANK